jgi:hypothetical protein
MRMAGLLSQNAPLGGDTLQILNVLLTAEKVETTLYAVGLQSGVLNPIDPDDLTYFQAATSEEFVHVRLLEQLGASIPNNVFFFPVDTFTNKTAFLNLIERLETGGVGAYCAAIFRFASDLRRPDLALLAGRILGVEAEHRVLSRTINGKNPPDDVCIEAVPTLDFNQIAAMFVPFLLPNRFGGRSVGPFPLPTAATVAGLVGPNACRMT